MKQFNAIIITLYNVYNVYNVNANNTLRYRFILKVVFTDKIGKKSKLNIIVSKKKYNILQKLKIIIKINQCRIIKCSKNDCF